MVFLFVQEMSCSQGSLGNANGVIMTPEGSWSLLRLHSVIRNPPRLLPPSLLRGILHLKWVQILIFSLLAQSCFFFFFLSLPAWEKWFKLAVNTFCSPSVSFISFIAIQIKKNHWHVIQYAHKLNYLFQLEFRSLRLKDDFHRLCCGCRWTDCHSAPDYICWPMHHKGGLKTSSGRSQYNWKDEVILFHNKLLSRRSSGWTDTADCSVSCFYTTTNLPKQSSRPADRDFMLQL